jgi:hypothetical protein
MNLSLVLLVIWQLESSQGKNMKHPTACYGHLGTTQAALSHVNDRFGSTFDRYDMLDRETSFAHAKMYIRMHMKKDWTVRDVIALWRCGAKGMKNPTAKQAKYIERGVRMYEAMVAGEKDWRDVE